jgi:Domain of unknown function (DUF4326)
MTALPELRGKDLVCWCAPLACHSDVLLRLARPELQNGPQNDLDVLTDERQKA